MIVGGQLQPGEFLPPQKELAVRFGVGASTIREAVQTLIAVGLLRSHPGKGTWVQEDSGVGLIHPEAVKARLGELERQVAGRGSFGSRGRAHRACSNAGNRSRSRSHPRRHDRDAGECGGLAGLHPG